MTFDEIKADTDFLAGTSSATYRIADKTRNANLALDEITGVIIGCDGTWQFDDTNYTDLPIGSTNLIINQKDYSFNDEFLTIESVEIKDNSGNVIKIKPKDLYQEDVDSITDYSESTGTPKYYDKIGNSIFLYPSPNYNSTDGLKVYFQRKMDRFEITDTTKEPGFASHLHRFVSICMSYDWAVAKQHLKMNWLLTEKNRYIDLIKKHYSKRQKDEKFRLRVIQQNNK